MNRKLLIIAAVITLLNAFFIASPDHSVYAKDSDHILTFDFGVEHTSTVPANYGEEVLIFVREKVSKGLIEGNGKIGANGKVVLFVHGGTAPAVAVYDLPFEDYSWAEFLARAGFDVFMMDLTGYGFSPRPEMDDPCNANPDQQEFIIPNPLSSECSASYPYNLNTRQSEWDEMNSVVDYILALRGVERVNLIGWSAGGPRIGGYAALYPEKVDKLYFYAGSGSRTESSDPPAQVPADGFPMNLQTHDRLMDERWEANVGCSDQVNYNIRPVVWNTIMRFDTLGSTWGNPPWNPISSPTGGVMRTRTATSWGWNAETEAMVKAPSLLIAGEFDMSAGRIYLYEDLGSDSKVFIEVACASHFLVWENQHNVLLETSKEWFLHGSIRGLKNGMLTYDADGKFHKK